MAASFEVQVPSSGRREAMSDASALNVPASIHKAAAANGWTVARSSELSTRYVKGTRYVEVEVAWVAHPDKWEGTPRLRVASTAGETLRTVAGVIKELIR